MKQPHTPGPWSVHLADESITCNCAYILSDVVPISIGNINVRKDDSLEHSEYPEIEEAEANAKLIAAAPELLEGLIFSLSFFADKSVKNQIAQLIKKATI